MLINVLSPPLKRHQSPLQPQVAPTPAFTNLPLVFHPSAAAAAEQLADGGRWKPSIVGGSRWGCSSSLGVPSSVLMSHKGFGGPSERPPSRLGSLASWRNHLRGLFTQIPGVQSGSLSPPSAAICWWFPLRSSDLLRPSSSLQRVRRRRSLRCSPRRSSERASATLFTFSQKRVIHHKTKEDLAGPDVDGGRPPGDPSHLLESTRTANWMS